MIVCSIPKWAIYLIQHDSGVTYVGATTDVKRRLRQHNGEIGGGSKYTNRKGPTWHLRSCIGGFTTKSEAYRWEALVKKRTRGLDKRLQAMVGLLSGKCPKGKIRYIVPKGLYELG